MATALSALSIAMLQSPPTLAEILLNRATFITSGPRLADRKSVRREENGGYALIDWKCGAAG
jgi:hypothetical protein